MTVLPWQTGLWQQLEQRRRDHRLPHALLLAGPGGIGKRQFAINLAHSLLCNQPQMDGSACGQCRGCQLLAANTHPDLRIIEPEEVGKAIKVDQIRALAEFTTLTAQYNGYKLVILEPAEQMNRAAANSLLKTLEEPAADTIILLVSAAPQRLLPTVRSRCQSLVFSLPETALALEWLEQQLPGKNVTELLDIAGGAPLTALTLAGSDAMVTYGDNFSIIEGLIERTQDPLKVAANWQKQDGLRSLQWFTAWVMDMIRLSATTAPPHLRCQGLKPRLQALTKQLELMALHRFLEQLNEANRLLATSPVNQQLLFEDLLVRWSALPRRAA